MGIGEVIVDLAVFEGSGFTVAIERKHTPAGRFKHSLAGARIPLHRSPPSRVNVGAAFCDQAKFERRAGGDEFRDAKRRHLFGGPRCGMISAADAAEARCGTLSGPDRLGYRLAAAKPAERP